MDAPERMFAAIVFVGAVVLVAVVVTLAVVFVLALVAQAPPAGPGIGRPWCR